jgi:hypothetical protein
MLFPGGARSSSKRFNDVLRSSLNKASFDGRAEGEPLRHRRFWRHGDVVLGKLGSLVPGQPMSIHCTGEEDASTVDGIASKQRLERGNDIDA